jgi:tripartite-type tricarboxylate transporter receptor subunit TctC
MPVGLRNRVADDVRQALDDAALTARLAAMGLTVAPAGAEEFAGIIETQRLQVHEIARIIGLSPTDRPDQR